MNFFIWVTQCSKLFLLNFNTNLSLRTLISLSGRVPDREIEVRREHMAMGSLSIWRSACSFVRLFEQKNRCPVLSKLIILRNIAIKLLRNLNFSCKINTPYISLKLQYNHITIIFLGLNFRKQVSYTKKLRLRGQTFHRFYFFLL